MTANDFPIIDEMAQFAAFPSATQSYIRKALSAASGNPFVAKNIWESAIEIARRDIYHPVPHLREHVARKGFAFETWSNEFGYLHRIAQFEVQCEEMQNFEAFGFLMERLIGPNIRPWLLSLFLAAVAGPGIVEEARVEAIASITASDAAHDIVNLPEPRFFPSSTMSRHGSESRDVDRHG